MNRSPMKLHVHTLMGEGWSMEGMSDRITVLRLKRMIFFRCALDPARQVLTFQGEVLPDRRTLAECHLQEGSAVHLTVKPATGFQLHRTN